MAHKIPTQKAIEKEFNDLFQEMDDQLKSEMEKLKEGIIEVTPVDTGKLKASFSNIIKHKRGHYRIRNSRNYSYKILVEGRTGPGMGSLQLPKGIYPFVRDWVKTGNIKGWKASIDGKSIGG